MLTVTCTYKTRNAPGAVPIPPGACLDFHFHVPWPYEDGVSEHSAPLSQASPGALKTSHGFPSRSLQVAFSRGLRKE